MAPVDHQGSAKILQFPRRVRPPTGITRRDERHPFAPRAEPAVIESGSGWYHQAAIQDAGRDRKP